MDVTIGSAGGKGLLDKPERIDIDGDVIVPEYSVVVSAATFQTVAVNDAAITADGKSYRIHEVMADNDGSYLRILLNAC